MKQKIINNFILVFVYVLVVVLVNRYFNFSSLYILLGGLVGYYLPDLDHLLYIFILRPQDLTSQRFTSLLKNRNIKDAVVLAYDTTSERKDLIFHTFYFQVVFLILTFWVLTSSNNFFVKGLVLGGFLNITSYLFFRFQNQEIVFDNADKTRIFVFIFVGFLASFLFLA